ncbi:MAG: efflux RND transporter periplasmic adaptor subunit [Cyanobacteria bacterium P01_A01_bin.135]
MSWLTGAAVLLLAGIGGTLGYAAWQNRSAPPVAVRQVTAERGRVEEAISESGVVQYAAQTTLKSPADGAVDQVLVEPGEAVIVGQTLLVLRNAARETATGSQQLEIDQQTVTLERSQTRIAEAEEQLAAYQSDLQRLSKLEAEGAIPYSDIRTLEDDIRRTESELQDSRSSAEEARLRLAQLQTENRQIEQELEETVITAPISGQVLDVTVNPGDGVELRTELLTLGDPSQELVRLELSTLDAGRISLGQPTRVSVIGPSAETFAGRVVQISPLARSPESEAEGQTIVPTLVRLDQATRSLIPGSQVSVDIILDARDNVTVVNTEAVQQQGGKPFVWVSPSRQQVQRRPIQIGLEGISQIEIEAGLQPGEAVIVPPPGQPLVAGDAIMIESAP